jgi:O-Antigen ligase
VTPLVLILYGVALAAAAAAVWRRPIVALYVFIVGLALHNLVLSLLYDASLRGWEIDVVRAWKEVLLAVAVARVVTDAIRERKLPFQPRAVDWLALAFAAVVCLYALVPQDVLDGAAGTKAILYGLRHGLVPVVAYFLGRSLILSRNELRRLGWALLGAGAALAVGGLIDLYAVDVEWWRGSGAVGYFRYELGFDYHGPGGLPDNWAFNTEEGLFRRLVSSFISPLATAFALVVALLFAGVAWQDRRRRPLAAALVALCAGALLFTLSRSSLLALAGAFLVLAVALRRWRPVVGTAIVLAAGVGYAFAFTSVAPETHFFPADLPYQEEQARKRGDLPGGSSLALNPGEPSLRSHWQSLRDGIETVVEHPQGYGLGNAGATAVRFGVPLRAGESNYTETGVEAGLVGALLLIAWSLALLVALVRSAWAVTDATFRVAAAGAAAALAAVLALAVQTDAYGVPWLAYSLWWLCGSLVDLSDRG